MGEQNPKVALGDVLKLDKSHAHELYDENVSFFDMAVNQFSKLLINYINSINYIYGTIFISLFDFKCIGNNIIFILIFLSSFFETK